MLAPVGIEPLLVSFEVQYFRLTTRLRWSYYKTVSLIYMTLDSKLFSININNLFNKGNNKITELRTILQRESQNS